MLSEKILNVESLEDQIFDFHFAYNEILVAVCVKFGLTWINFDKIFHLG